MDPSKGADHICGTKVERSLPHSVDRLFYQSKQVLNAVQRDCRQIASIKLPAAILLSPLSAELSQFLRMRVKKALAPLHCGRPACITSLRPSLAEFSAPLF
jgi:hypothetical protein